MRRLVDQPDGERIRLENRLPASFAVRLSKRPNRFGTPRRRPTNKPRPTRRPLAISPRNFRKSGDSGATFLRRQEQGRDRKQIDDLERQQTSTPRPRKHQRELAKAKQIEGDAAYWPIFNLDCKNPKAKDDFEHLPPEQLADDILQKELRHRGDHEGDQGTPGEEAMSQWQMVPLSQVAKPIARAIQVEAGKDYRTIGVKWWGEGAYERQTIDGSGTAAQTLSLVYEGDLIINKIWVRHGSIAIATKAVDGCAASNEFPTFELDRNQVEPRWIHWLTKTKWFWVQCDALSMGTSGKNRIKPERFLLPRQVSSACCCILTQRASEGSASEPALARRKICEI